MSDSNRIFADVREPSSAFAAVNLSALFSGFPTSPPFSDMHQVSIHIQGHTAHDGAQCFDRLGDPGLSPSRFEVAHMATEQGKELRVDASLALLSGIDAILMVDGLKSRADWVIPVLEKELERQIHRATVLLRCTGVNPFTSTNDGKDAA